MSAPRLSSAQARVMAMLGRGWTARVAHGSAVHINGERACNVDTMTALERMGLVERDSQWAWKATRLGKRIVLGEEDGAMARRPPRRA